MNRLIYQARTAPVWNDIGVDDGRGHGGGKPGMGGVLGGCVGGAYPSMGAFRTAHEVSVDQSGMTKRTGKVTRLKRVISPFLFAQIFICTMQENSFATNSHLFRSLKVETDSACDDMPRTRPPFLTKDRFKKNWCWPSQFLHLHLCIDRAAAYLVLMPEIVFADLDMPALSQQGCKLFLSSATSSFSFSNDFFRNGFAGLSSVIITPSPLYKALVMCEGL